MAVIKPFRAVTYNAEKAQGLGPLVAPPYDVISPQMQDKLYDKDPHNIIRLILGRIEASDNARNNRYTRARIFFESWLKEGFLRREPEEAIYIYTQNYNDGNKDVERVGFVALLKLASGKRNSALAHENTLKAPKEDRLNLLREVKANLSPIFVLYDDTPHKITRMLKKSSSNEEPFIDVEFDGTRHRVWALKDARLLRKMESAMKPKDIFIADGHHRYEVALKYCAEVRNKSSDKELRSNAEYLMAYFVESDEEMLTVLPAHRLIKDIGALKEEEIEERLQRFFLVEKAQDADSMMSRLAELKKYHAFGMYAGRGSFRVLRLKDPKASDSVIENNSKVWKELDVTILHLFILKHLLNIRDDDDNIEFVKDANEAVGMVDSGKFEMAFFLNPTKVSQVKAIARLGEKMPRKATYFYPKPLSGLVINKLT